MRLQINALVLADMFSARKDECVGEESREGQQQGLHGLHMRHENQGEDSELITRAHYAEIYQMDTAIVARHSF